MTGRYVLAGFSLVAALAWAILAAIHLTHPGLVTSDLESTLEYVHDAVFTVALLTTAVAAFGLAKLIPAPRFTGYLVALGELMVFVGVFAGLLIGESPSWFAAVGIPGNLLVLIGFAIFGWFGFRSRAVPRVVAVALFLMIVVGLGATEIGGNLLPAAVLAYVGVAMLRLRAAPLAHIVVSTQPSHRGDAIAGDVAIRAEK